MTKTTKSGHVFTRDTSHPTLGEAWRDPGGTIWGDLVMNAPGVPRFLKHGDASAYCRELGAELPSREDFTRLRGYLGAEVLGSAEGYVPQILPNLTYEENGRAHAYWFWTSSVDPRNPTHVALFNGRYGTFDYGSRVAADAEDDSFRCVIRP